MMIPVRQLERARSRSRRSSSPTNGLDQRSVRSASRSHYAGKRISKGPQAKAACPSVASALDTQPPHDPHSQTLAAPVPTFLAPPATPAETPKSGPTTAEARPCSALRELRPRRGDDPKRLLPALCRRRRMATKLGARSRTGEAFRRVRTSLFMSFLFPISQSSDRMPSCTNPSFT